MATSGCPRFLYLVIFFSFHQKNAKPSLFVCLSVWILTSDSGGGHEHDWQSDGRGENPVADVDYLGVVRRPEVQCFDRVTHGDVAVDAHGGEREDRGEHVVVVDGHHHLAQRVAERPGPHQVVDALERQRAGDQGIGESEVEDVDVGGRLHFSVSAQEAQIYHETTSTNTHKDILSLFEVL